MAEKTEKQGGAETETAHDHEHGNDGHDHHGHHHHHGHEKEFEFVEPPVFDVNYKGDCAYEVKVSIAPANHAKKTSEVFDELRREADVPGFRRGKAPRKLLEHKFSKAVRGDVEGKLVSAAFQKLVKDQKLRPIGTPDLDGLDEKAERNGDEPLTFTLKFEVAPRVELGKYRGIEVERPIVSVDDKDIEEAIEEARVQRATYESLEGGVAADGDQVIIDFKGTIDGEVFQGGSAENYPYILGSKRFFPEFEKTLLGASPNAPLTCTVTFPDDYGAQELRGKKALFELKVHEVKRKSLPGLNDEFASALGHDTVDELRTAVGEQLRTHSRNQSKQLVETRALAAVIETSTYEIPASFIDSITKDNREGTIRRMMESRIPYSMIEERMAKIDADSRESAIRSIKALVTLNEIGEAEGVEVTEEDFENEALAMASTLGVDAALVSQYLASSSERGTVEERLFREKTMGVILAHAVVTEKELTRDEMDKAEEAEDASED